MKCSSSDIPTALRSAAIEFSHPRGSDIFRTGTPSTGVFFVTTAPERELPVANRWASSMAAKVMAPFSLENTRLLTEDLGKCMALPLAEQMRSFPEFSVEQESTSRPPGYFLILGVGTFATSTSSFGTPNWPSSLWSLSRSMAPTIFTIVNWRGSLAINARPIA